MNQHLCSTNGVNGLGCDEGTSDLAGRMQKIAMKKEAQTDYDFQTPVKPRKRKMFMTETTPSPAKKAAEAVLPELSAIEQQKADRLPLEHGRYIVGSRIYALWDRFYYAARHVRNPHSTSYPADFSEQDASGRYEVIFVEDGAVRKLVATGIIPLCNLIDGVEVIIFTASALLRLLCNAPVAYCLSENALLQQLFFASNTSDFVSHCDFCFSSEDSRYGCISRCRCGFVSPFSLRNDDEALEEVEVLKAPSLDDAEQWLKAMFNVKSTECENFRDLSWTKLVLNGNQAKQIQLATINTIRDVNAGCLEVEKDYCVKLESGFRHLPVLSYSENIASMEGRRSRASRHSTVHENTTYFVTPRRRAVTGKAVATSKKSV
ncbi:unnamed protein product [Gongylonema pulchrum]|uniref:PH domain-containing protein n=1 Tax=Gongylonema pulchrum TaxID=637853 RepID=A0A183CZV2_9BILA|nr:unnamed protein product [Gongylonema pulchrum]